MIAAQSNTGNLRAQGDTVILGMKGYGAVGFAISGTFVGTITFQGSVDGQSFITLTVSTFGGTTTTTASGGGQWLAGCAGLSVVRVNMTAFTSGVARILIQAVDLSGGGSAGGGGGGGGAVTISDGADAAEGATTDPESVSGDATVIALLKRIRTLLGSGGSAVSIADGADVAEGAIADAAVTAGATGTVSAKLRSISRDILTDTQLRATPVPVSGTVTASGPLTDTQLRATPVPVSGTVTASGPLTDTQLRATPVPVSGTVTTGGLTDTQLRATPVPISGTVAVSAGSAVIGHVLTDTGSTTAVTQPTGSNLHTVIDSGTITTVSTVTAVTSLTNALPAGANIIGKVGIDQTTPGTTNAVALISGQAGVAGGAGAVSATVQRVVLATDTTVPNVSGDIANDAADSGNPVKIGGQARTTNPTKVADADRVNAMCDVVGRQVVAIGVPRELIGSEVTTITSSTTATAITTAAASTFHDLTALICANISATATEVILYDDDGTTVRGNLYVPAGDVRGIVFSRPLTMPVVNKVWKLKTVTSIASLKVTAQYEKNI